MRDFARLAAEANAQHPAQAELWTRYFLDPHPYSEANEPSEVCLAHHFDRGLRFATWFQMVSAVGAWVESQPGLHETIEFEPFYEVGTDFFTQEKPPYDGGYSTGMYGEFLNCGDCEPAPWYYQQQAELYLRVAEALHPLRGNAKDELLRKVLHATFIRPYRHLFWRDVDGWAVYQPNITADDVRACERLSGQEAAAEPVGAPGRGGPR